MNIPFFSAKKLASLLRRRKMRSVDLLDLYLDRVARLNPKVNAVVVLDEKRAREQARKADRAAAKGNWLGPLHGVPMTVKESFDVEGLPTTWGRADMKSNIAAHNALAVQRLRDAGAVIFGKSNVPVMLVRLADLQSGLWHHQQSLGRDAATGRFVRWRGCGAGSRDSPGWNLAATSAPRSAIPPTTAACIGHKPTFELCPIEGHNLPPNVSTKDMLVIGPLARSADDLETSLKLISQPDRLSARGIKIALQKPKAEIRKLRIAVLTTAPNAEVDDSVQAGILAAAAAFARKGAKVSDKARPDIDLVRGASRVRAPAARRHLFRAER